MGPHDFRLCGVPLLLWSILSGAFGQDIPSGFKVDRYVRVWERNPFTLVKPTAPERLPSPFEKLFLASWLKVGGKEVVFVQNSETNQVQRITAEANQNNLRLIETHLDPNAQFVAAVISDGKQQGSVKFRFDAQIGAGRTASGVAQLPANSATGQVPKAASSQTLPRPPVKLQNAQTSGFPAVMPVDPSVSHHVYPGVPRVHTEGGPAQVPRPEEVRRK